MLSVIAQEFPGAGNHLRVCVSPLYQDEELQRTVREILKLRLHLVRLGLSAPFRAFIPRPIHARCASAEGGYTFAPDGKLYTCAHCMTQDQCFGSILDAQESHPARQRFISRDISEKCRRCLYLPFCLGGCRAVELGLARMEQCSPDVLALNQLFSGEDDNPTLSDPGISSSS